MTWAVLGWLVLSCSAWADDLGRVLKELDKSAANFHSTTADFEFDTIQTDPFPDKDVQKGTAYYERKGATFSMAAHIDEINGKPVPKIYTFIGGQFKLDDVTANQVISYQRATAYESYVMLGFGASGKELADKWNIKYLGQEVVDGTKTDKLELIAKDPNVLRLFPKVTIWMDTERAVSLRQIFDEGAGTSRTCTYSHIKTNVELPKDAFTLKTNKQTHFVK